MAVECLEQGLAQTRPTQVTVVRDGDGSGGDDGTGSSLGQVDPGFEPELASLPFLAPSPYCPTL